MIKIHPQSLVESEHIGEGTCVWAFAHVMRGAIVGVNVNIGDHAFLESGCVVGNNVTVKNQVCIWEGIVIEDDVFVGPRVTFTNDRYPRSPRMEKARGRYASRDNWLCRTHVRKGCSLGAGAVICPGVVLGEYCVVAAGAVVTKDIPPFALVAGTPARRIKDVCSCGEPLEGPWDQTACTQCGEVGLERLAMLEECNSCDSTLE